MQDLPKPLLGEITAFTITTSDLETSLACYEMLGYKELFRADWPFRWIQITDGVVLIMLREDTKPYLALTYYVKDIAGVTADLERKGIQFEQKPKKTDPIRRFVFRSPDGLAISLVSMVDGFKNAPGPGMLGMRPEEYANPDKYVNKTCGLFGELAHPVANLEQSEAWWQLLGFRSLSSFSAPYPWAIMTDGLSLIGLHQSDHFSYPAITYFAADSAAKIAALEKAGLKNFERKGTSDVVITTPEHQHIFLFHLGGPESVPTEKPALQPQIMETERLELVMITPDIYDQLFHNYSDAAIMNFLGLQTPEQLATEKNNHAQGMTTYRVSFRLFLMREKATGLVIGRCGYHNWYREHQRSELGYALSDESKKQQGLMKEALTAVIRHGFEEMQLNRIEAFVGPENIPSLKLVQGFGFTREGTLRAHFHKDGIIYDSVCFSLLRNEYNG